MGHQVLCNGVFFLSLGFFSDEGWRSETKGLLGKNTYSGGII